jgi:hypothetical protein
MKRIALALLLVACEKKQDTPPPAASAAASVVAAPTAPAKLEKVEVPELRIKDDAETTVKVAWLIPQGTAVNDDAPFKVRWNRSDGLAEAPPDAKSTGSAVKDGYSVKVKPMKGAPNPTLGGEINLVVCDAVNHSICLPVRREIELGFVVAKDAAADVKVEMPLPAAK